MLKQKNLLLGFLVALTVTAGGLIWWSSKQGASETSDSQTLAQAEQDQLNAAERVNGAMAALRQLDNRRVNFELTVSELGVDDTEVVNQSTISGIINFIDPQLTSLSLSGNVQGPESSYNFQDLQLVDEDQTSYYRIGDISLLSAPDEQQSSDFSAYTDQWYSLQQSSTSTLPFLPEVLGGLLSSSAEGGVRLDTSRLLDAVADQSLFQSVSEQGEDQVGTLDTVRYSFNQLDPSQTATLLLRLQNESSSLSQEDVDRLTAELEQLDLSGQIWLGKEDNQLRRLKLTANPADEGLSELKLGLDIRFDDLKSDRLPEDIAVEDSSVLPSDLQLNYQRLTSNPTDLNTDELTTDDQLEEISADETSAE